MTKFRRITAALLALALVFSLGACAAKNDETTTTTTTATEGATDATTTAPDATTTAETTTEAPTTVAAMPYDKYAPVDMKGREVRIAQWWDFYLTSDSPVPADDATPADVMQYDNLKRIEQKYNMKLKNVNVPWDQYVEKYTTSTLAGDPFADIVSLHGTMVLGLVAKDLVSDIKDFAPANSDVLNDQKIITQQGTILGKSVFMNPKDVPTGGYYMGVNMDIINAIGAENPLDLYNSGNWTWAKFEEIAKLATKDTDGDGVIDQYGYSGTWLDLFRQLSATNSARIFDGVGKKSLMDSPNVLSVLDFMKNLYSVDKAVLIKNDDLWAWDPNFQAYRDGKSAFFVVPQFEIQNANTLNDGKGLPFTYNLISFPVGPNSTDNTRCIADFQGYTIPRGVKDAGLVYQIYEEFNDWWGNDYSLRTDGTMEWLSTVYNTEDNLNRAIKISDENLAYDEGYLIPGYDVGKAVGGVVIDGKTPAQAVQENMQIYQDAINAVLTPAQ